jgi:Raf kinase inhibitor-like YbhB/YbcL family protein
MKIQTISLYIFVSCLGYFAHSTLFAAEHKYPKIDLTCPVFKHKGAIPLKYMSKEAEGENKSPALSWKNISQEAKSLAIVFEDVEEHPGGDYHWIIYNISPKASEIPENIHTGKTVSGIPGLEAARQLKNDFDKFGYTGASCPMHSETHTMVFRLYELDTTLNLKENASVKEFFAAIEGHIKGYGELFCKCQMELKQNTPMVKKFKKNTDWGY